VNDSTQPAFDRAKLVELFGDDPKTIAELEQEFLKTAREAEREIMGTADADVIARAAHRLKGASGMIGALALHMVSESVERTAKAGDMVGVRRLLEAFRTEVRRVARQVGGA
jgi:HPt (histidine-containing phosphotransfer) domain-containing protein